MRNTKVIYILLKYIAKAVFEELLRHLEMPLYMVFDMPCGTCRKAREYVIMPNHIHLIIQFNQLNGKEKPTASFLKETSHLIIDEMLASNHEDLYKHMVEERDRSHRVWQRDSLAIEIVSKEMMEQKLEYIHNNPIQEKWQLVGDKNDYLYSSSSFYNQEISGDDEFVTDYRSVF